MLDISSKKIIRDCPHWFSEINQLFHPTGEILTESQDVVYSYKNINQTKFTPLLLKELFALVRIKGYLVIDYEPNEICDWQKLEELMWWIWKGKYNIIFHSEIDNKDIVKLSVKKLKDFIANAKKSPSRIISENKSSNKNINTVIRFVCQKNSPTAIRGDKMSRWSFGIITNGKKNDWMETTIKSIYQQKIPEIEIIVCGNYFKRKEKNFKYIKFIDRVEKGWITKKKNIIASSAKYENLCILHDRVSLDKNWYEGMKKWGNCFEVLSCAQTLNGKRALADWVIWERGSDYQFGFATSLDYRDWDKQLYQSGQVHILKKKIAEEIKWDETVYWGGSEDIKITYDSRDKGYILRFNPFSNTILQKERFIIMPTIPFDPMGLSRKREGILSQIVIRKIFLVLGMSKKMQKIILYLLNNFPARKLLFKLLLNIKDNRP